MALDGELLDQWRAGDHEAFATLYGRHSRALYLYLVSLVGDTAVAEDLLQETFLRVIRWEGARRNGHGTLGPYLATIARNKATDWLRRTRRDREARRAIGRTRLLRARECDRPSGLTAQEASELLWRLPPEQLEVVVLRIYGSCSFADIAGVTGAPINTVISRFRYGLEKIRDALEDVGHDAETKP
jgi:RNA polymerase sigma-70 factor, ECF subfamily